MGHITRVHFNSSVNGSGLVYLDLSNNHFSGENFSNLNEAQSLKHLNLAYNRFSKQLFPENSMLTGCDLSFTPCRSLNWPWLLFILGGNF